MCQRNLIQFNEKNTNYWKKEWGFQLTKYISIKYKFNK